MDENNKSLLKVIKFTIFSISAGLIQIASFAIFNSVIKMPYWPSYLISLLLSILWNFTLNRKFTFKDVSNVYLAMIKVIVFYAVFTPVSTLLGNYFVNNGAFEYLVLAISMISNLVLEFLFMNFFVFKNNEKKELKTDVWAS